MLLAASAFLAATLAVSHGQPAPPVAEDEARIEALVAAERGEQEIRVEAAERAREDALPDDTGAEAGTEEAPAPLEFPPPPGTKIAFEDLDKMKGYAVRVRTRSGHSRSGTVQQAGRNEVQLRVRMGRGYAEFSVARKQVVEIEAE